LQRDTIRVDMRTYIAYSLDGKSCYNRSIIITLVPKLLKQNGPSHVFSYLECLEAQHGQEFQGIIPLKTAVSYQANVTGTVELSVTGVTADHACLSFFRTLFFSYLTLYSWHVTY
jgi:hypothetical protein